MAEFEQFSIGINVEGNAANTLEKIANALEAIKIATGNTNDFKIPSFEAQAKSAQIIATATNKVLSNTGLLTKKQLDYNNASIRAVASQRKVEQLSIKQNELAKKRESLLQKEADLKKEIDSLGGANTQNGVATTITEPSTPQTSTVEETNNTTRLTQAKKEYASVQKQLITVNNQIDSTTRQQQSANDALVISTNNLTKANISLNESKLRNRFTSEDLVSSLKSIARTITTITQVVSRLARGVFSAIKASGEFVENLNLFAVTFGENYQKTLDWALDFADNLGVASSEIVRFTGLFKQLAVSIGVADNVSDKMSKTLTQLGYDLASYYNIDTESAFEKLQAGIFAGQTKPLRSLGLDVTAQTLDDLLKTNEAFKNIGVSSSKGLLQAEKAMLRMIAVLQNSRNSFGDMKRTINTLSNQIRVFQGSWENLKLAIGDVFSEPFKNALTYINGFIIGITKIIRVFKPLQKETEIAANSMKQYADETEDAADQTDKEKSNLDIDEFRSLSSAEDSELSASEAISAELERQLALYDELYNSQAQGENMATKIAESIKNWFVVTNEDGSFGGFTDKAKGLLAVIIAIGVAFAKIKISSSLSAVKTIISDNATKVAAGLNGEVKKLTTSQKLLNSVFSKSGLITSSLIGVFIYGYATNEEFRESVNKLVQAVLSGFGKLTNIFKPILGALKLLLDVVIELITPIINLIAWFANLGDGIGALIILIGILVVKLVYDLATKGISSFLFKALLNAQIGIYKFSASLKSLWAKLGTTKAKFIGVGIGVGLLVYQVANLVMNWDKMSGAQRVIGILGAVAATAFVAAIAITGMQSAWTLGIGAAAIALGLASAIMSMKSSMSDAESYASNLSSSISGFATGGITDANLIMTHENGVREWVGKQGHSTAVVNDTQMSSVMSQSVRDGLLEAMSYGVGNNQPIDVTVQAVLDGQKIYESTKRIARKNGQKFANV